MNNRFVRSSVKPTGIKEIAIIKREDIAVKIIAKKRSTQKGQKDIPFVVVYGRGHVFERAVKKHNEEVRDEDKIGLITFVPNEPYIYIP